MEDYGLDSATRISAINPGPLSCLWGELVGEDQDEDDCSHVISASRLNPEEWGVARSGSVVVLKSIHHHP